jgi:hypothetical protein
MVTKEDVINANRKLIKRVLILENNSELLFNAELENRINSDTTINLETTYNSILYLSKIIEEAIENQ